MKQLEFQYFWPLTEQVPLDLDFSECHPHQYYLRAQGVAGREGPFATGTLYVGETTWGNATITPSLSINPTNAVGEFTLGSLNIGMERKPNLLRRTIYKLLGFDWKDK